MTAGKEYWSTEYRIPLRVLEYWSTGVLEYWSTGVLDRGCPYAGVLIYLEYLWSTAPLKGADRCTGGGMSYPLEGRHNDSLAGVASSRSTGDRYRSVIFEPEYRSTGSP